MNSLLLEYELGGVLGKGTYSEVFSARRRRRRSTSEEEDDPEDSSSSSSSMFAIKRTRKALLFSPLEREMPQKEICTLETLGRHPNSVFLYEAFEDEESVCLVLELAPGVTLEQRLRQSPLGLANDESRAIMFQLLQAVLHVHLKGIAHRDISPRNVLVDDVLQCKLIDFGLAAPMTATTTDDGDEECKMGESTTASYASSADDDVWSLGVLAYELLSGASPKLLFGGKEADIHFPDEFWADKDALATAFTRSLLAKDAASRPTIAQALQSAWFDSLRVPPSPPV